MLPLDQQYDTRTILNKKSNFPNNFCKSIPLKSAPTGCPKKRVTLFVNPGLIEMWSRSRSHLDWVWIDRKCNAFFGTPCRYRTCQYYFCFSKSPLWISLEYTNQSLELRFSGIMAWNSSGTVKKYPWKSLFVCAGAGTSSAFDLKIYIFVWIILWLCIMALLTNLPQKVQLFLKPDFLCFLSWNYLFMPQ